MKTPIQLNAFDMAVVGHQVHGMWTHPRDRSTEFTDTAYWADLAVLLERGLFDAIFFADNMGVNDVIAHGTETSLRNGAAIPGIDPLLIIPAMAHVTRHLGFSVTANLTFDHPYLLARRFTTLDHLTGGRIGWNIVTGILESGARLVGAEGLPEHDLRYEIADEFMEVVYKFWEHSWQDDAMIVDKTRGLFADPTKVHPIEHRGRHYRASGIYPLSPSPQRTPVLYQAGSSARGTAFAARHAECVFLGGHDKAFTSRTLQAIRQSARAQGRDGDAIRAFQGCIVITGETNAIARDKFEEFQRYVSLDAALANLSGSAGVDLSRFTLDEPIGEQHSNARQTVLAGITGKLPGQTWTLRDLLAKTPIGNRQALFVGTPAEVVDQLEAWVDDTGVSGFNIARVITHETIEDFVRLVVPELQSRGRYKTEYAPGTLREKLFATAQAHLPRSHPARAGRSPAASR